MASTRPSSPSDSGSPVTSHVWKATTVAMALMPNAASPRAPSSARNSGCARSARAGSVEEGRVTPRA